MLIGSIGAAPATGEFRMTFDSGYLSDGIPIVIVGLGMFALPEIVDLLRRNTSISETGTLGQGWLQGLKDAIRHKWIVIRCSVIGCIVGALPGLGGKRRRSSGKDAKKEAEEKAEAERKKKELLQDAEKEKAGAGARTRARK